MTAKITYDNSDPQSGPHILGTFITTAVFMTNTNSTVTASNATLTSAAFSNNNELLDCRSPPQKNVQTATIIVAGNNTMIFKYNNNYSLNYRCRRQVVWTPNHSISITDMATSS